MLHKEVMLGNILQDNNKLSFLQVDQIIETGFSCKVLDRSVYPLKRGWKAVGVEITKEILLSIGFYNKNGSVYYTELNNYSEIRFVINEGPLMCAVSHMGVSTIIPVKYLHQLQNLYFILTGEKLDVSKLLK